MSRRNDAVDVETISVGNEAGGGSAAARRAGLYVVGAGGVGRETLDTVLALGEACTAFLDDGRAGEEIRGVPVLAPGAAPPEGRYLVAIADPAVRLRLVALLAMAGLTPRTLVHPRAIVAPGTALGPGCLVQGGAYVSSDVVLGAHSQVHYNATVGHDAVLGERATVYPGANVSGSVLLGAGVTVGSNAVVLQGLRVGDGAFVGAGAVVTRDVPPGAVMTGSPARRLERGRRAGRE